MQEPFGVLAVGLFVGFLLGTALANSKPGLQAALTVLSVAFGGVAATFVASSQHRWLYPVGLVFGFLWLRGVSLMRSLAGAPPTNATPGHRRAAFVELVGIVLVTGIAVAYGLYTPTHEAPRAGTLQNTTEGKHEQFVDYGCRFVAPPQLTVTLVATSGKPDFSVVESRVDGFRLQIRPGTSLGANINWQAIGQSKECPAAGPPNPTP